MKSKYRLLIALIGAVLLIALNVREGFLLRRQRDSWKQLAMTNAETTAKWEQIASESVDVASKFRETCKAWESTCGVIESRAEEKALSSWRRGWITGMKDGALLKGTAGPLFTNYISMRQQDVEQAAHELPPIDLMAVTNGVRGFEHHLSRGYIMLPNAQTNGVFLFK